MVSTATAAELTGVVGALQAAAPDVIPVLNNATGITVFAPINEAFQSAESLIASLNTSTVAAVLLNHVVNGTVLYSTSLEETVSAGGSPCKFAPANPHDRTEKCHRLQRFPCYLLYALMLTASFFRILVTFMSNSTGAFVMSGNASAQIVRPDIIIENGTLAWGKSGYSAFFVLTRSRFCTGVVHLISAVLANTASNPDAAASA